MKTRSIARGIVGSVAALLGVMAAGCSADVAPGEAAEIGSSEQAITASSNASDVLAKLDFGASCVIHDGLTYGGTTKNKDYLLKVGGYNNTSGVVYSRTYEIIDPSAAAGSRVLLSGTFGASGDEVAYAQAIQVPGTPGACMLIGGEKNVSGTITPSVKTWKFTLAVVSNALSVSIAQDKDLNDARSKFAISRCAGNHIIIAGGYGTSGALPTSIEVWPSAGAKWASFNSAGAQIATGRSDLAMSANSTVGASPSFNITMDYQKFLVAGGFDGSNPVKTLNTIQTDSSCANIATTELTVTGTPGQHALRNPRDRASLFVSGESNKFVIAGGDDGGSAVNSTELITVDWTTTSNTSVAAATTPTNFSGVRRATLATNLGASALARASVYFALSGGEDGVAGRADLTSDTQTTLLQYVPGAPGAWTAQTAGQSPLANTLVGHVMEYLPSQSKFYAASGVSFDSTGPTTTDRTDLIEIAVP